MQIAWYQIGALAEGCDSTKVKYLPKSTWNFFVLYFCSSTLQKNAFSNKKQGSFGFQVHSYTVFGAKLKEFFWIRDTFAGQFLDKMGDALNDFWLSGPDLMSSLLLPVLFTH